MNIQKTTEKYNILDNGCVIIPAGETIIFKIMNVSLKISFSNENKDVTLTRGIDGFELNLYKQNNANFSGTTNLIELGSVNGHKLYFMLNVKATTINPNGEHNKIIFYTWFIDK